MSVFMNTPMFLSTHATRIDGKGRVSFPAPFRNALTSRGSQGVVLYQSTKFAAIEGVTLERIQQMAAALEKLSPDDPARADFETTIFGTAHELAIDKEGRCSVPRLLLDHAGIDLDLIFLGRGQTFQVWEPQAFAQRKTDAAQSVKSGAVPFPILTEAAA
jgi:MraZ protein